MWNRSSPKDAPWSDVSSSTYVSKSSSSSYVWRRNIASSGCIRPEASISIKTGGKTIFGFWTCREFGSCNERPGGVCSSSVSNTGHIASILTLKKWIHSSKSFSGTYDNGHEPRTSIMYSICGSISNNISTISTVRKFKYKIQTSEFYSWGL